MTERIAVELGNSKKCPPLLWKVKSLFAAGLKRDSLFQELNFGL
jgi:hypothetical protein